MRQPSRIILAVLAVTVILLGSVSSSYAQKGLGGRPANPNPEVPRSSSIFIHTLEVGETVEDAVTVSNDSAEEQTIEVYATDGMITGTGAFSCRQQAEEKQGVGDWVKLDASDATLAPGEQKEIPFTITMPAQVDVGEHNGCIVFQAKEQDVDEAENMQLRFRSAVRLAIVVPGDIRKELSINTFDISHENGGYTYATSLQNTGNVSIDTDIQVVTKSLFGREVYRNGGEYPVLAREELDLQFRQDEAPFWGGFYTAQVMATYDTNPQVFGVEENESLRTIDGPSRTVFITPAPAALILYVLVLAAIGLAVYYLVITMRRRKEHDQWESYTVKSHETLASLADSRAVSWKRVAKANKLKPPYIVQPGDRIKLPPYKKSTKP